MKQVKHKCRLYQVYKDSPACWKISLNKNNIYFYLFFKFINYRTLTKWTDLISTRVDTALQITFHHLPDIKIKAEVPNDFTNSGHSSKSCHVATNVWYLACCFRLSASRSFTVMSIQSICETIQFMKTVGLSFLENIYIYLSFKCTIDL